MKSAITKRFQKVYTFGVSAWTPERREKQRQVALKLVEEGKFGGPGRGQGRRRQPTALERVAERTKEAGDVIFERFIQVVEEGKDRDAIQAGDKLLTWEREFGKVIEQEEAQIDQLRRDEVLAFVVGKLAELNDAGIIPGVIEGEAVELVDEGTARDGQTSGRALEAGSEAGTAD